MFDIPFNNEAPVSKCVIPSNKITVSLQSDSDDSSDDEGWIQTFCLSKRNQNHKIEPSWFCAIDKSFFDKELIQYDKSSQEEEEEITNSIELIKDEFKQESERINSEKEIKLQCLAEHVYGLFHAKYILTKKGLEKMREKFEAKHWGTCPRYYCYNNPVLPYGKSNSPGVHCVQVYCPVCKEIYDSFDIRAEGIDGAYFGPTFAIMFCKFYPQLFSCEKPEQILRIHGFRIANYKNKSDFFTMTEPPKTDRNEKDKSNNSTTSTVVTPLTPEEIFLL